MGVTGSFGVIGLIYIIRDEKLYLALSLILAFALFTFVTGRAISFINVNFYFIGFYESRFIAYLLLAIALIAPIAVLKFKSLLDCSLRKPTQRMLVSVLSIGLLVVSGASTTFLNVEYCNIAANDPSNKPSTAEIEAITFLRNIFDKDSKAFLATITSKSLGSARFSAPAECFTTPFLYAGYGPEITLPFLYVHPSYSHGYLYMHDRDFEALHSDGYDNRYLAQHLIPMLPIVFKNSEVTVYNVSRIAPPLPLSDQILLFPFSARTFVDENLLFCYDMLSQGLYNYTTAFDLDNRIMSASTLLLSFDPKEGNRQGRSIEDYTKFVNSGGNLIILNTNGFGTFAKRFFQSSNNTFGADYIKDIHENLTLPKGIAVPMLELINETEEILSSFVSSKGTSPYITRVNIGEGQLFYVNVEPLARYMDQSDSRKSEIYQIIGGLLNGIRLKPYEFLSLPASDGYVKEIYLDEAVSINTTSILFPSYPDWVDDGYGKALRFDGDGDYISINNPSNLDITDSLSIFAWVKTTKDEGMVFAKYLNDNITWPGYAFGVGIWNAGNTSYWTGGNWVQGDSKVNDGNWHYIGIIHSGSTVTFYKDGVLDGIQPCAPRNSNRGDVAWIGRDFAVDSRSFEGLIKDIRVYNRTLSSAEVFDLYNGKSVDSKGLVLHLPMDEGFGPICHDVSGENNNGKWQNTYKEGLIREIRVTSADGISVLYNVTSIQLSNYSQVTIQSSETTIKDGESFYTQLSLKKPTKLDFTPNAHLTITSNEEKFEVANISTILTIMDRPITLWARTPIIWADTGTFKEAYSLKGINGGELVVRGGVTFSVVASDSYSSLNNFQIKGSYISPSQNYYDELQSLRFAAVPACILAVPFTCVLLPVWLMRRKHKRIRFQVKLRKTT
jgi:hypothetical protein